MLESLNCVVLLHSVGTPVDFLKVIAQQETAPQYLIIIGHGAKKGLHFGNYIPEIDSSMLNDEYLPAEVIRHHVRLKGCHIIADCCWGATKDLSEAFLSGGAVSYGGSVDAIGLEMNVFLVNFLYRVLHKKMLDAEAWSEATQATGLTADKLRYSSNKPDVVENIGK